MFQFWKERYQCLFDYVNENDPWLLAKWLKAEENREQEAQE